MNAFPTSIRSSESVCSLWTFILVNELNLLLFIVAHNQVLRRCAVENDLSGVQEVAGFTSRSLTTRMIFGISDCSLFEDSFKHLYISLKQVISFPMTIVRRTFASTLKAPTSTSSPYIFDNISSISSLTPWEYKWTKKTLALKKTQT